MDLFLIGILLALILIVIEIVLSSRWSSFYFNKGLQIYSKNSSYFSTSNEFDSLIYELNKTFEGNWLKTAIIFKKIDSETIAFRKKLFEITLFNNTPLMHGRITVNNSKLNITGFINWFPLAFISLWYVSLLPSLNIKRDFIFLVAPILIFGLIYFFEVKKFNKVVRILDEISKNNKPNK